MSWTQERINVLVKLWLSGKSASAIAKELGNVTRNAVIGKVHRLGISNRDTVVKTTISKEKSAKKDIVVKKPRRVAKAPVPDQKKITVRSKGRPSRRSAMVCEVPYDNSYCIDSILDLTDRTCKWPIGHPNEDDFHFCGCPVDKQSSGPYCSYHMAMAYTQQPSSRSERTIQILETAEKITVNNNITRKDDQVNENYVYPPQ